MLRARELQSREWSGEGPRSAPPLPNAGFENVKMFLWEGGPMYGNGFVGEEKGTERESVMMMSFRTPQCYWESEDAVEDEVIRV
ncbi:hypothetical protein DUI87_15257 [Hirundo rustica rustica]|uniref:Uncharacterized protein n=1 Tax=Hirundo rustica rustica TaxID=333673 RepID=A0A3M0K3Z8_HIRRU|nr:hypothetical protein DUI87_15257 [Hirundo rustica rustica]